MKTTDFLTELSTDKLAQYKTAAAADASKADKEKDFARGNKRFSGIVKATNKQFDNDAKQVKETVGLPYPGTYEETNDMFKSGGQRRVGTLTTEQEVSEAGTRAGALNSATQLKKEIEAGQGKRPAHEIDNLRRMMNALMRKYSIKPEELNSAQSSQQRTQPPPPPGGQQQPGGQQRQQSAGPGHWWERTNQTPPPPPGGQQGQQSAGPNWWQQASQQQPPPPPGAQQAHWNQQMNQQYGFPQQPNAADPNWANQHMAASNKMMQANQAAFNNMLDNTHSASSFRNMPNFGPKGVAEGNGNYAGDRPVNLGGVSMKMIQTGDTVKYIDQKAQVVDMSPDRKYSRITIPSSSTTKTVLTSDLRQLGQGMAEGWSQKYKKSINCSHPKGFSQKAHCAGKKKHNESVEMEMVCEDCGMCETHGDHENLDEACWKGYHKEGNKKMFGKTYPNCVKNTNEEQEHSESCPHCGGEMVSEELMNEKKDACYYKVKSRYKVWPSAYASGALVKCRNKGASNWGNSSKNESSILEGISQTDESLHDWFNKEKWVRMDTKGNIKGPCAKEPGEGKPKCLPQSKAHSLGKKGRASAAARKRREDPNPDRSGKAINVNTKKETKE